jgi:hypothetical protein
VKFGDFTVTPQDSSRGYMARLDVNGNVIAAQNFGTTWGIALAVDGAGNLFTLGGSEGSDIDTPPGAMLLSISASGDLRWQVGANVADEIEAFALVPDGAGGAWVAGTYAGTARFGKFNLP